MTIYLGTSWKMHKTTAEARAYARQLNACSVWPEDVQPFVIPPHTAIEPFREALEERTGVRIGAQNAHWALQGAYTGEVSMEMVKDVGATLVEIGHSERREHFQETDTTVGLKVAAALSAGLTPLVCIGEDLDVRRRGGALEHLHDQATAALARIEADDVPRVLLAYEPVWSIGDGGTPASMEEVAQVAAAVSASFPTGGLLYGGSVTIDNAGDFLEVDHVDGLFIGRAAWRAEDFLTLVELAGQIAKAGQA